jgi:SNF2 family DNA or RNA helicase
MAIFERRPALTKNGHDMLWSDDDEPVTKPAPKKRNSLEPKQRKIPKPNAKPSQKSRERTEDVSDDETDEWEGSKDELYPEFKPPRFGPFELEPYELSPQGEEDEDRVPASIARYLPLHQREGLDFLYKCLVTSGHGAILGDDMVSSRIVSPVAIQFVHLL